MAQLHIIGAGIAGLAAAVAASGNPHWRRIRLYEATQHAGGRCRSFFDERLDRVIDNGNHLLLGGNRAALAYIAEIGGAGAMTAIAPAAIPFLDLASGDRWTIRPSSRPWWALSVRSGMPPCPLRERLAALRLLAPIGDRSVAAVLETASGSLFDRFWDPLTRAILNTEPSQASARLLRRTLLALGAAGESGYRPHFAHGGLSAALVEPALRFLNEHGVETFFGWRARGFEIGADRVEGIDFSAGRERLERGDALILAVPPEAAAGLVDGLRVPGESRAIVNAHYRIGFDQSLPDRSAFLGVIGGTAQWLFHRGDVLSVTVSAADRLSEHPAAEIAAQIWNDVARALDARAAPMPPYRVIKEKRATIAQTPRALALRPGARTRYRNLILAGDWIDTGLPATIEGAVRAGRKAARLAASGAD